MTDTDTDKQLIEATKKASRRLLLDIMNRIGLGTASMTDFRLMRELRGEILDESELPPVGVTFPNLLKALDYLTAQGYQIKKSSLYNHKKAGLLRPNASGEYDSNELDRYAAANLTRIKRADGEDDPKQQRLEELQQEKFETNNLIAQEQLRLLQRRNTDIDKEISSRVAEELVKREGFFKVYLINYFTSEAPNFIETVHGDHQYLPEFIELARHGINTALGNLVQYRNMTVACGPSGEVIPQ